MHMNCGRAVCAFLPVSYERSKKEVGYFNKLHMNGRKP